MIIRFDCHRYIVNPCVAKIMRWGWNGNVACTGFAIKMFCRQNTLIIVDSCNPNHMVGSCNIDFPLLHVVEDWENNSFLSNVQFLDGAEQSNQLFFDVWSMIYPNLCAFTAFISLISGHDLWSLSILLFYFWSLIFLRPRRDHAGHSVRVHGESHPASAAGVSEGSVRHQVS